MPVTAKLSRAFYERLGDEIANELVSWFNAVDLTYRTELRELNDLNFARFDAKVGERLAELRAEMDARFARAEGVLAQRLGGGWGGGGWGGGGTPGPPGPAGSPPRGGGGGGGK